MAGKYTGIRMQRYEAKECMGNLAKEYDYQSSRLLDDVKASSDVAQRMMILGSLYQQMIDVSEDFSIRVPRP